VITRQRGSKSYINGRPSPLQSIKELAALLVDIHGQHEHHGLLKTTVQRQLLDHFGDLDSKVTILGEHYQSWQTLQRRLQSLTEGSQQRQSQLKFLDFQITELQDLDLQTGEYNELGQEQKRLAHTQELLQGLGSVVDLLFDNDAHSAHRQLSVGLEQLQKLQDYAPELAAVVATLEEARILTDDATNNLRQLAEHLEADPQQLQVVEDRLGVAHALARKHRISGDELPRLLEQLRQQRQQLQNEFQDLDTLDKQLDEARSQYQTLAAEVSSLRQQVARTLSGKVTTLMPRLGMTAGQFRIHITPSGKSSHHGRDQIEFEVSTNPGQTFKSLKSTASGGELSRISLAIQVTCSHKTTVPTIIFDEVDVGIGGGVAETVGRLLHRLGASCQVLCITHLGQVAALGDQQLAVTKNSELSGQVTVTPLSAEQRTEEVARMLGGQVITDKTRAHAREMLALATAGTQ